MKVNILEAKNNLSQLIRAAQTGEEVVIANRGEPVARLVSVNPPEGAQEVGSAGAILGWLELNSLPESACRSADEIDAAIREERDAWE